MTLITSLSIAYAVADRAWSATGDDIRLIVNVDGVDDARLLANGLRGGFGTGVAHLPGETDRGLPGESFARVFTLAEQRPPDAADWIPFAIGIDTQQLTRSSLRLETTGSDLLRLETVLVWGRDAAGAVIPLAALTDVPTLSQDPLEGLSSIPLGLVDAGDDLTQIDEVIAYIGIAQGRYSETSKPVSLRFGRPDGTLVDAQALEGFEELVRDGDRGARIWRLVGLAPFAREIAGGALAPVLRVEGADNAEIDRVVLFGVDRSGAHPRVVPLTHHVPAAAGTNAWVGSHEDLAGRDMVLPLCAAAPR